MSVRDCLATGQGRGQCVHGGELCLAFLSKVAHGDSRFADTRRQLREFHIKPLVAVRDEARREARSRVRPGGHLGGTVRARDR